MDVLWLSFEDTDTQVIKCNLTCHIPQYNNSNKNQSISSHIIVPFCLNNYPFTLLCTKSKLKLMYINIRFEFANINGNVMSILCLLFMKIKCHFILSIRFISIKIADVSVEYSMFSQHLWFDWMFFLMKLDVFECFIENLDVLMK